MDKKGRQNTLRDHIECSVEMGVDMLETELNKEEYSPHDVADLLKLYLRELPEPLLTENHYVAYLQVPSKLSSFIFYISEKILI